MAMKKQMLKGELSQVKCKPCEGGDVPLTHKEQQPFMEAISKSWERKLLHQKETLVLEIDTIIFSLIVYIQIAVDAASINL